MGTDQPASIKNDHSYFYDHTLVNHGSLQRWQPRPATSQVFAKQNLDADFFLTGQNLAPVAASAQDADGAAHQMAGVLRDQRVNPL